MVPHEMNRTEAEITAAALADAPPQAAFAQGIALLKADYPELLLPGARALAQRHPADPRLAQLLGLAARAAGHGPLAHTAFRCAASLAPHDPLIAHSHARAALEAGDPAAALFEHARRLAPGDGTVLQGLAAALLAEGKAENAVQLLSGVLSTNPLWTDGHRTLAHLQGQLGREPLAAIEAALAQRPAIPELHRLRIATLLEARRTPEAPGAIAHARASLGGQRWLDLLAGHAASELGETARADAAFAKIGTAASISEMSLIARHAIRSGRFTEAARQIEPWLSRADSADLWPYAALAWRMTGDPRAEWLEGDAALIGVYDLADRIADLPGLAEHLRRLHMAREAPLDQSVRGGTQTDGNLLLRADPPLQALRRLLLDAVCDHFSRLPRARAGHPTLLERREPLRIAGSWSVRLSGAGFHADHVHSQGWYSSALYVSLPETIGGAEGADPHAGWLTIGEARELIPALAPLRLIEPRPGRLVLFPSTMWHGTRAYSAGERLTVAFDIARPKQD